MSHSVSFISGIHSCYGVHFPPLHPPVQPGILQLIGSVQLCVQLAAANTVGAMTETTNGN